MVFYSLNIIQFFFTKRVVPENIHTPMGNLTFPLFPFMGILHKFKTFFIWFPPPPWTAEISYVGGV